MKSHRSFRIGVAVIAFALLATTSFGASKERGKTRKARAAIAAASAAKRPEARDYILSGSASDLVRALPVLGEAASGLYAIGDRRYLLRQGRADLAETLLVHTRSKAERRSFRRALKRNGINLVWTEDARWTIASTPEPFETDEWFLKNRGESVKTFLDDFHSQTVPGVVGEDIRLPARSNEGEGVIVAVLDTGVEASNPDLRDRIVRKDAECRNWAAYQECRKKDASGRSCAALVLDADGNGYPMDCEGWSYFDRVPGADPRKVVGSPDTRDKFGHGTHVAGLVAAAANGYGVRGIAPKARILPVQVISEDPSNGGNGVVMSGQDPTALTSNIMRGMTYAAANGAKVINLSLGWNLLADGPQDDANPLHDLVQTIRRQGILVVAAAGNDGTDALVFPCQYSDVLCVGAHGPDGVLADFSNHGSGVDIAAPGLHILSDILNDCAWMPPQFQGACDSAIFTDSPGFDFKDGTSMATPIVAGAAAVLLGEGIPADEAIARLLVGARAQPLVQTHRVLSGNLDVQGALAAKARPYFAPLQKGFIPVEWDGRSTSLHARISLKNLWIAAKNVRVSLALARPEATLGQTDFALASLETGKSADIDVPIRILDRKLPADLPIVATVSADNAPLQTFQFNLLVSRSIDFQTVGEGEKILPIEGAVLSDFSNLYRVIPQDGSPTNDYFAVKMDPAGWQYQFIREEDGKYVAGPIAVRSEIKGIPAFAYRLDVNLDGKPDYVVTYKVQPPEEDTDPDAEQQVQYFRFDFLDENGRDVLPPYTFVNKTAVLHLDDFAWMRLGNRLVPAWITAGFLPADEKSTKIDPWNPGAPEPARLRAYYFDPASSDGLRTIPTPAGMDPVTALPQSLAQRKAGVVSFLYSGKGDFYIPFYTSTVRDPRFAPGTAPTETKVAMPSFRNLLSLADAKLLGVDESEDGSVAYQGNDGINEYRVTVLSPNGSGYSTRDLSLVPPKLEERTYFSMGSFLEKGGVSGFVVGDYDMYFHDAGANPSEYVRASLRKYSFLPSQFFMKSFYPLVAEIGGQRVPGLRTPDLFGSVPGVELLAPRRDSSGKTLELYRPAALRFLFDPLNSNCEEMPHREATAEAPAEASFFCGDRVVRIPYRVN